MSNLRRVLEPAGRPGPRHAAGHAPPGYASGSPRSGRRLAFPRTPRRGRVASVIGAGRSSCSTGRSRCGTAGVAGVRRPRRGRPLTRAPGGAAPVAVERRAEARLAAGRNAEVAELDRARPRAPGSARTPCACSPWPIPPGRPASGRAGRDQAGPRDPAADSWGGPRARASRAGDRRPRPDPALPGRGRSRWPQAALPRSGRSERPRSWDAGETGEGTRRGRVEDATASDRPDRGAGRVSVAADLADPGSAAHWYGWAGTRERASPRWPGRSPHAGRPGVADRRGQLPGDGRGSPPAWAWSEVLGRSAAGSRPPRRGGRLAPLLHRRHPGHRCHGSGWARAVERLPGAGLRAHTACWSCWTTCTAPTGRRCSSFARSVARPRGQPGPDYRHLPADRGRRRTRQRPGPRWPAGVRPPRAARVCDVARWPSCCGGMAGAAGGRATGRSHLVAARTGGNPLFVCETARLIATDGTGRRPAPRARRGRDLLRRRLARLPGTAGSRCGRRRCSATTSTSTCCSRWTRRRGGAALDGAGGGVVTGLLTEPAPGRSGSRTRWSATRSTRTPRAPPGPPARPGLAAIERVRPGDRPRWPTTRWPGPPRRPRSGRARLAVRTAASARPRCRPPGSRCAASAGADRRSTSPTPDRPAAEPTGRLPPRAALRTGLGAGPRRYVLAARGHRSGAVAVAAPAGRRRRAGPGLLRLRRPGAVDDPGGPQPSTSGLVAGLEATLARGGRRPRAAACWPRWRSRPRATSRSHRTDTLSAERVARRDGSTTRRCSAALWPPATSPPTCPGCAASCAPSAGICSTASTRAGLPPTRRRPTTRSTRPRWRTTTWKALASTSPGRSSTPPVDSSGWRSVCSVLRRVGMPGPWRPRRGRAALRRRFSRLEGSGTPNADGMGLLVRLCVSHARPVFDPATAARWRTTPLCCRRGSRRRSRTPGPAAARRRPDRRGPTGVAARAAGHRGLLLGAVDGVAGRERDRARRRGGRRRPATHS